MALKPFNGTLDAPSPSGLKPFNGQLDGDEPEGGLIASLKQTVGQGIKGTGQAAADYLPGVTQDNALKQYGQEVVDANPTAVRSMGDIAESPWTATKEAVGNALGSMGAMVGANALGRGIQAAAPFLPGAARPVASLLGKGIEVAGPVAAAALPSYGGIREAQIAEDPTRADDAGAKARALAGAGAVGLIERSFGPEKLALSALTKEGRAKIIESMAGKSLAGSIGKGMAKGAAVEGAEELVQNPVEQFAAYQDPTTPENLQETAFGGAMGALGGGVLGGAGGGISYAARPEQPQIDPNAGPLSRAAATAQATGADTLAQAAQAAQQAGADATTGATGQARQEAGNAAQDPSADILSRITPPNMRAVRQAEGYGPESVNEVLRAAAIARNPEMDPLTRQQAAEALNSFWQGFDNRPNWTRPNAQQPEQPGTGVVPFGAQGTDVAAPGAPSPFGPNTLDGDATEIAGTLPGAPRQLVGPEKRFLEAPDRMQAKRDADAAYEQAYQDLVKAEQLGASDTELLAYQQALADRDATRQQLDAQLADTDARVSGSLDQQTAQSRLALLDQLDADPETRNLLPRFESALKKAGFSQRRATPEERALIARRMDARSALVDADQERAAPNELDAAAMGIRERKPIIEPGIKADNSLRSNHRPGFPMTQEGAQRRAAEQSQASGQAFEAVPHPTVSGRFTVQPAGDATLTNEGTIRPADQFRDATKMVQPVAAANTSPERVAQTPEIEQDDDPFEAILRESRQKKAVARSEIGDVSNGAVVADKAGNRFAMVLPDVDGGGKWRIQQFDSRGFVGHSVYNSQDEALNEAIDRGFVKRDDTALDRLQNTPEFARGNFITDLVGKVNARKITSDEFDRRIQEYDAKQGAPNAQTAQALPSEAQRAQAPAEVANAPEPAQTPEEASQASRPQGEAQGGAQEPGQGVGSDLDTVAERVTEPTHSDPGQPAEAATAPVVAKALQKSARNTAFNAKEAKAWLLGEIDRAIADAPAMADKGARFGKGEDSKRVERANGGAFTDFDKAIGFVTFDVPGDGTFKVLNTKETLQRFRDKADRAPGFSAKPERTMSYGTGNAQGPSLDETLKKLGNTPDAMQEIGNAIEIARLKKAKDEDKLLDRFREASNGKDYDAWRAEQEAEGEIASREAEQRAEMNPDAPLKPLDRLGAAAEQAGFMTRRTLSRGRNGYLLTRRDLPSDSSVVIGMTPTGPGVLLDDDRRGKLRHAVDTFLKEYVSGNVSADNSQEPGQPAPTETAQPQAEQGEGADIGADTAVRDVSAEDQQPPAKASETSGSRPSESVAQERTSYTVSEEGERENDDYTQDIAGRAVRPVARLSNRVEANPPVTSGTAIYAAGRPAGAVYATEAGPRQTGVVRSAYERVQGSREAAHVLAGLRKNPQEKFQVLVLGADNRPLAILNLFAGATAEAGVYPEVVTKAVYETPGAAKVWYAHNHPSTNATPSQADVQITKRLSQAFGPGTGIEVAGHVLVAGQRAVEMDAQGAQVGGPFKIPAGIRRHDIKITERRFTKVGTLGAQITSPDDAQRTLPTITNGQTGVVFLNSNNEPTGFLPFGVEQMKRLRDGASAQLLFGGMARSNAHAAIANFAATESLSEARIATSNLYEAFGGRSISLLDALHADQSMRNRGLVFGNGTDGIFFSRDTAPTGTTPDAIRSAIASLIGPMRSKRVIVAQTADELVAQGILSAEQANGAQAFVKDGKAYFIADAIAPGNERAVFLHEVGSHLGMEKILSPFARKVLLTKIRNWSQESGTVESRIAKAALRRVEAAGETGSESELLAYFVEEAVKAGIDPTTETTGPLGKWFGQFMAAVRKALESLGFINPKQMTAQDIVNLARGAARVAMGADGNAGAAQFSRDQTRTEAFRKWFGQSAVVDQSGEPLVVYHGTKQDIETFSPRQGAYSNKGLYFTATPSYASVYAESTWRTDRGEPQSKDGANVLPVYLSLQNPLVIDKWNDGGVWQKVRDFFARNRAEQRYKDWNESRLSSMHVSQRKVDELRQQGYDGIINRAADEIVVFDPAQVKSAIGNRGNFDPADARIQFSRAASAIGAVWDVPESSKLFNRFDTDSLLYTLQDKHIDTRRVVEAIRKQSGDIADEFNPYLQEELFHGRSAKGVKDFLDAELRPLLAEMTMRKVTMADLEGYLHARHAEERNVQIAKINPKMPDGGSGMTTQDAQDYLNALDPAKRATYDALASKIDAINKATRDLLVDAGLEKRETIDAWEGAYRHYVPLQREEVDADGMRIGQGFSVKGSASKRAMGSDKNVVDIIANIAMQRERAIVRAEKNRVAQALYGLSLKAPNPEFWMTINPAEAKAFTPKQQQTVIDELTAMGLDPADAMNFVKEPTQRYIDPRTGLVASRINPVMRSAPNVLSMRVNGEDRYVFFNASDERANRMVHALKNLDADQLGRLLQTSAKLTRYFSSINTQWNPVFGIVNLTRDVQGALLNLSTTPLRGKEGKVLADTLSALKGIYSDLRAVRKGGAATSQWASLWEEFQKEGGQTGYRDMFSNSTERAEAIEREMKKLTEGNAKAGVRAVFDWLSDYNESMENAVRLATYKAAIDQGISKQRAASIAKSITVNFNKKGAVAVQAGAIWAFFNASAQGSFRMIQTLRGPSGKKIILGGLTLGAVQALALAAAGFDDEEPPEFVRERSIIIPTGGGKYIAIPMPLGFHVIPNISRITTEWALSGFKHTPDRISGLLGLFADTFNPIGGAGLSMQTLAPTALDPLAALAENKDWSGKPIAREDFNSMDPSPGYLRAKDTASALSKAVAYWANLATGGTDYKPGFVSPTPDQLDYLIGQIAGGVGREYMKLEQTATSALTGEDLPPHKIPLLGRFYGDTTGQSSEANRFYANVREINLHKSEIDGRRKNGGDVMEYLNDNPTARLVMGVSRFETTVRKLRQARRDAMERGDSADRIKAIDGQITAVMGQFNQRFAELDK